MKKNREPTDIDMMKIMYPNEDIVDKIEDHFQRSQRMKPHLSYKEIMTEAYSRFIGTGKRDYIHFVGLGHEKSHGRSEREMLQASLLKIRDEQETVKKLKDVIASLNSKLNIKIHR